MNYFFVALAALAAGAVNALAGGGTLITFPALTAVGISAVSSNVTNTVALVPGYFGGTLAQLKDLRGQEARWRLLLPVAFIGGIVGGILLLLSGERIFRALVPFLILMAAGLLGFQDQIRGWVFGRAKAGEPVQASPLVAALLVFVAAIYGGYFGAGLGVITLAVLGLMYDDSLTRLNALKQALSFTINIAAAGFFLFSGQVVWDVALVMAVAALIGGMIGGRLAGRVRPLMLRRIVVTVAVIVAIIYLVR